MSTIATIHTLVPNANIPLGYFDEDNIRFIQHKITEVLKREYVQDILIDRGSIIRLMERAILDRIETVPKMNQRVVMYATNEFRNYQAEVNKHMYWEANYVNSQKMYDPVGKVSRFDIRLNSFLKDFRGKDRERVGSTLRFYFT